jgi:GT2 family glycosyltransferase
MHPDFDAIAAVIPVGPGDRGWRILLEQLDRLALGLQRRLVFAHGDLQARPRDPTIAWTESSRGRARQQNAGAAGIDKPWLWFLHADTRVTANSMSALASFLASGEDALAYFDLRFADDGPPLMRLNEWGVRARCRFAGLPFGDQGLLLKRERFFELGAFDESLALGEDHALVWAARRNGLPIRRIPAAIYTSARKYAAHGWLATTWKHQRLTWKQAWRERG